MDKIQLLVHEVGSTCNLAQAHYAKCPSAHLERFPNTDRLLDDTTILDDVQQAYAMGFAGTNAFHFYNEPTLQSERLVGLTKQIRQIQSTAKFLLWTNGTNTDIWPEFDYIKLTNYENRQDWPKHPGLEIIRPKLDSRMQPGRRTRRPCFRPFFELIIDAYGNHHLCCADYLGTITQLNVFRDGFPAIAAAHLNYRKIVSEEFASAPNICKRCPIKATHIVQLVC